MSSFLTALVALLSLFQLATAATYSNPIRDPDGSDPFIVYTGGYYYFLTTTWTDVEITRATTLEGLKTGTKKVVYSTSTASRCCNVWSPEVHYIDGLWVVLCEGRRPKFTNDGTRWYIYYTAGISADLTGQRINVLTGKYASLRKSIAQHILTL